MKNIYRQMAADNLKSNKKNYQSSVIINALVVMFIYLFVFIANNAGFSEVSGGKLLKLFLFMGIFAVAVFDLIFQFYINSFLMKRRKKEYGLYSILGLEKKHISKILFYENSCVFAISTILGIIFGILSGKGIFTLLLKLMKTEVALINSISITDILATVAIQLIVSVIVFVYNVRVIKNTKVIEMLKGSQQGNKESKLLSIFSFIVGAGLVILGCINVNSDITIFTSMKKFFMSVMMILLGTYLIYESVCYFVLKFLKKIGNVYYRRNSFFAISNLLYRNKQNAAGLASICIIMTVINLVMTLTVSLYSGTASQVKHAIAYDALAIIENAPEKEEVIELAEEAASATGVKISDYICYKQLAYPAVNNGSDTIVFEMQRGDSGKICILSFVSSAEYDALEGTHTELAEDEVLVISENNSYEDKETISVADMKFNIRAYPESFLLIENQKETSTIDDIIVIVNSDEKVYEICDTINEYTGRNRTVQLHYEFSSNASSSEREVFENKFRTTLLNNYEVSAYETKTEIHKQKFAQNSVYLFLGFFLSLLFMSLMLIVMYHKQMQEALDDKPKYVIMRKIGFSCRQVKTIIFGMNSALYLLPVVISAAYAAVMLKTVKGVLKIFMMADQAIILKSIMLTFGVVLAVYITGYLFTQKVYIRSVLDKKS